MCVLAVFRLMSHEPLQLEQHVTSGGDVAVMSVDVDEYITAFV